MTYRGSLYDLFKSTSLSSQRKIRLFMTFEKGSVPYDPVQSSNGSYLQDAVHPVGIDNSSVCAVSLSIGIFITILGKQ